MKVKLRILLSLFILSVMLVIVGCSNNSSSTTDTPNNDQTEQKNDTTNEETGEANNNADPKRGGELTAAIAQILSNLDPLQGSSGHDFVFLYNIYKTLIEWDKNLEAQPGLATSWETPDETTIILHLREGVTFHDGTPFDAEAVKMNLDRANSDISRVSDLKNVDSIEVVDTYTVQLNLKQPDSSILLALSDRSGMMVSPKVIQDEGSEFKAIGTGPFKFVDWDPNGELVLEANEDYWEEGLPYLDKLTIIPMADENTRINALSSGQIDVGLQISTGNVPTLEKNPNLEVVSTKQLLSWQMYLNTAKAPLDNKNVRQAMLYAIDREGLNKALMFGLGAPAHQHFPEGYWAHNSDVRLNYDPEKSKQLLREAGLENVELDIAFQASGFPQRLMEAISSQLGEVGIQVNLMPMELTKGVTEFFAEKRFNAGMWQWSGRPDPQMTAVSLWGPESFYNAGDQSPPGVTEALTNSAATYEPKEREKAIREVVRVAIEEEAMSLPLLFEPDNAVMSTKVKGFEGNLAGKAKLPFLWLDQ